MTQMRLTGVKMPAELLTLAKAKSARCGMPLAVLLRRGLAAELGLSPEEYGGKGKIRRPPPPVAPTHNKYQVWLPMASSAAISGQQCVEVEADRMELDTRGRLQFMRDIGGDSWDSECFEAGSWTRWKMTHCGKAGE